MLGKYLGTIKFEEVAGKCHEFLKEPGDLLGYFVEGDADKILHVSYRRNIVFFQGDPAKKIKPFLLRSSNQEDCLYNLRIKNFTGDPEIILAAIKERLIKIIGFDFDLTLTLRHVFFNPDHSEQAMRENLVYPEEIRIILAELAKRRNCVSIIVSNNSRAVLARYVSLWFKEQNPFYKLCGNEDFHTKKEGDKEVCYFYLYKELINSELFDKEGFLQVERLETCRAIDVVDAYIIDDLPQPSFAQAGLKVIQPVVGTRNFLIELKFLFHIEQLRYGLSPGINMVESITIFKHLYHNCTDFAAVDEKAKSLLHIWGPKLGSTFHLAVRANCLGLVRYYLERDVDLTMTDDTKKWTALQYACVDRNIVMLEILLLSRKYSSQLPVVAWATMANCLKTLEYVLSLNLFNVDTKDDTGFAAIHYAASDGHPLVINRLRRAGVNLNVTTTDNMARTALHVAVLNNKKAGCMALITGGCDIFKSDGEGYNACQLALLRGHNQLYDILLIPTGCRVNDRLANNRTLLTQSIVSYYANGQLPFNLLLIKQIDASLADGHGDTPLSLALGKSLPLLATAIKRAAGEAVPNGIVESETETEIQPGKPFAPGH